jgi:hypothetical protein
VQVEAALAHRATRRLQLSQFKPHAELRFDAAHVAPALQHQRLLETHGCSRLLHHLPLGTRIPTHATGAEGPAADAVAGRAKSALAPVSADATCARLAAVESAQVVLSSGAFRCLANTFPGEAWELPVTVRQLACAGAGAGAEQLQVVFVDNPVPACGPSLRAKNQLFYKVRVCGRWWTTVSCR